MKAVYRFMIATSLVAPASMALAADDEAPVPEVYNQLMACRAVATDAERLACFDRQVAAMQEAEASDSIMVVDREEVRDAERGLFGLRLPRLFGGSDEDRVAEIESTITDVGGGGRRRPWRFALADGSVWAQTDTSDQLSRNPREGHTVIIRRAALGSFRAEIDGMRLIRVERVR